MFSNEKTQFFASDTLCLWPHVEPQRCFSVNSRDDVALLFIPQGEAALRVAVVSALHGRYVGVFVCVRDKVSVPGGPVVQFCANGLTSTG